jgi:hypothetical protein
MPIESWNWLAAPGLLLMVVAAALYRWRSGRPFRFWRLLAGTLLFGLVGPPIGGLAIGSVILVLRLEPPSFTAVAVFMLASWLVAAVPALVGGVCAALVRPVLRPGARLAAVAACCGLASGLFSYGLMSEGARVVSVLMAGLGAMAGVLIELAWLGLEGWRGRRGRAPAVA